MNAYCMLLCAELSVSTLTHSDPPTHTPLAHHPTFLLLPVVHPQMGYIFPHWLRQSPIGMSTGQPNVDSHSLRFFPDDYSLCQVDIETKLSRTPPFISVTIISQLAPSYHLNSTAFYGACLSWAKQYLFTTIMLFLCSRMGEDCYCLNYQLETDLEMQLCYQTMIICKSKLASQIYLLSLQQVGWKKSWIKLLIQGRWKLILF